MASRIQKLVEGGEIVVGRSTKLQIEELLRARAAGREELRGFQQPVETYRVLGMLRARRRAELPTPLVGTRLRAHRARARDGRPRRGTRHDRLDRGRARNRQVAARRGGAEPLPRPDPLHRGPRRLVRAATSPYWPIRDLLRDWLSLGASAPEARLRLELKTELSRLFGADAEAAYPFIASLLGLTLEPGDRRGSASSPGRALQHETFELFNELVARLARRVLGLPRPRGPALGRRRDARAPRGAALGDRGGGRRSRASSTAASASTAPGASASARGSATRTATGRSSSGRSPTTRAALLAATRRRRRAARVRGGAARRARGRQPVLPRGGAARSARARASLRRENGRLVLAIDSTSSRCRRSSRARCRHGSTASIRDARELVSVAAVIGRTFDLPLLERILSERAAPACPVDAPAARARRRAPPPPGSRVQLPSRPRAGGRVREPRRGEAAQAPPEGRRGDRGAPLRLPRGRVRRSCPSLRRGGRPREGGRLPPPGGRRGARALRGPRSQSSTTARRATSSPAWATSAGPGTRCSRSRWRATSPSTSRAPRTPTTRPSAAVSTSRRRPRRTERLRDRHASTLTRSSPATCTRRRRCSSPRTSSAGSSPSTAG